MSRIVRIGNQDDLNSGIQLATEILNCGRVVLYPTDTTYALAVNALNAEAVDRVFQLKGRDYSKPIHVVVKDMEQAAQYVMVENITRRLAEQFLPGALTLVLPQKADSAIPSLLVAGTHTLGVRMPDHPVCIALAERLNFPITTTSANRSGMPNTYTVEAVEAQLGADFQNIDLILDAGHLEVGGVSTVIAVEDESIKLIREGAIPFATLTDFISQDGRKA
jgi:L-threonylcarbamoyladenylate synthase